MWKQVLAGTAAMILMAGCGGEDDSKAKKVSAKGSLSATDFINACTAYYDGAPADVEYGYYFKVETLKSLNSQNFANVPKIISWLNQRRVWDNWMLWRPAKK